MLLLLWFAMRMLPGQHAANIAKVMMEGAGASLGGAGAAAAVAGAAIADGDESSGSGDTESDDADDAELAALM